MNHLTASINVVLPLLIMMLVGKCGNKIGVMTQDLVKGMNRALFYIFLPATVFKQIYALDLSKGLNVQLVAYSVGCVVLITVAAIILTPKFERDPARAGSVAQAIFRGNFIIFGIAISEAVYGDRAVGVSTLLVSLVNPFCNAMGTACFDIIGARKGTDWKHILKNVVTTPTIIASLSALALVCCKIRIPVILQGVIADIGKATTPMALISLGATFTFMGFKKYRTQIVIVSALKLFIIPILVLAGGACLGFRNESLVALFALISVPVASSSFPVASVMGGDADLAAQLLIATSILSIVSVFFLVFGMRSLMLI